MFNMATGSGKTLIMAGLILYLYSQGYRKFLFFVNSDSIVQKTKDNFLNATSSKFLFKSNQLRINQNLVNIKTLENFEQANNTDIQIIFQTIQGLHTNLNNPKENSITKEDLEHHEIVLISDEAHHINASTKKQQVLTLDEYSLTWEHTAMMLFKANSKNLMLDFTATMGEDNLIINEKYKDKLIYKYDLKSFNLDCYSKRIKILQADVDQNERILNAVILSQFRRKVFGNYRMEVKPIILIKSKTIAESQNHLKEFSNLIKTLTVEQLEYMRDSSERSIIQKILAQLNLEHLLLEIQTEFTQERLIEVNSKTDEAKNQIDLNSLEDSNNPYRVVFAVDKLNEGWDVLNLFDIVKLYETKVSKKIDKSTVAEAQLIGRGARYYPFDFQSETNKFSELDSKYKRKFDDDLTHPLAICEELYFHSSYNPPYIRDLNLTLEQIGLILSNQVEKRISLKKDFIESDFYLNKYIYLNRKAKKERKDIQGISSLGLNFMYEDSIHTGLINEIDALSGQLHSSLENTSIEQTSKIYYIRDFPRNMIEKALNQYQGFQFKNLKELFPNLNSTEEFIKSSNYLADIQIKLNGKQEHINHLNNLSRKQQLSILIKCLGQLLSQIESKKYLYIGTKEFDPRPIKNIIVEKSLYFDEHNQKDSILSPTDHNLFVDISKCDWFVYKDLFGTSEEFSFIKDFHDVCIQEFRKKYNKIYLIRNESFFKIYEFDTGQGFQPDFVLFLSHKESDSEEIIYQIFIEPKGDHLLEKDRWKEEFLLKLNEQGTLVKLNTLNQQKYIIWGLPFYNASNKSPFTKDIKNFY